MTEIQITQPNGEEIVISNTTGIYNKQSHHTHELKTEGEDGSHVLVISDLRKYVHSYSYQMSCINLLYDIYNLCSLVLRKLLGSHKLLSSKDYMRASIQKE